MISEKDIIPVVSDQQDELVGLWELSVRATHHFLTDADIKMLKPLVKEYLGKVEKLLCICNEQGEAEAFMGVHGNKLEMLFVHPRSQGKGLGKTLVNYAIRVLGINEVDVNEQNPLAIGFYEHLGFQVYDRSARDGQGNPFPLLHLRLKRMDN